MSKFSSEEVQLGMTKTEFVKKFGQPYNKEMFLTADNHPMERLFYKEQVYSGVWCTIITAFTFSDSRLVEQEFVKDERVNATNVSNQTME